MHEKAGLALVIALGVGGCRGRGPEALSAAEIGVVEQSDAIEGRDGGSSAWLWDRSIWTFGDTVLTLDDERGHNWHHNSFSVTTDTDASDGLSGFSEPLDAVGAPQHLIPPSTSEQEFNDAHWGEMCEVEPCGARWAVWPGEPVWDADHDRALVFYGLIYAEPGDFNFMGVGHSIATWTDPDGHPERPVIDVDAEHPDLLWSGDRSGWGIASNIVDGQLYTFACETNGGLAHDCMLARVELSELHVRSAWRYFDGDQWSTHADEAKPLFEGAPVMSVSFNEFLGEWLAVYSTPFSSEVVARTAPDLTGPWSRESLLYDTGQDTPYDALAHAEYEERDGQVIYVTYSRHTSGWFGTEFPLVRIELAG
ncbi:DUF4185 domain-containing protein [Paraliomyxa miuraensis]|uniref:DUF4185 domain-containing protein n=1 Tax=Paraliomyxa miuraensis TaxID=376150 RepID=UPI0022511F16|nr:DUF4185 domain-containing protein [Paraliomyxa miuraensis]MCX4247164.1 DUF4185 domain-containing protein [Paraliomyxa miuraensis]